MAIQDNNTFLSKGDLKTYHEKILPYLGGNMMMSTNNSDYYSTDEKVVGVWTDGKPLYQKTLVNNTATSGNKDLIIGTISGAGTIFIVSGFYINNTSDVAAIGAVMDLNTSGRNSDTRYASYTYVRPNGNVGVYYGSATATTKTIATVRYTKTTDTASTVLTTPGAYDINFPNTWPIGKEIFFGNGMYGIRVKSNFTATTGQASITVPLISSVIKPISFGGNYDIIKTANGKDSKRNRSAFTDTTDQVGEKITSCAIHSTYSGNTSNITIYIGNDNKVTTDCQYDMWVTYTK